MFIQESRVCACTILYILSFIYFLIRSTDNIAETEGHWISDDHTENMESET